MVLLGLFLNDLASIRELFNDTYVSYFLKISDRTAFEKIMKQSFEVRNSVGIREHVDFEGKAVVALSKESQVYKETMKEKLPILQEMIDKIPQGC